MHALLPFWFSLGIARFGCREYVGKEEKAWSEYLDNVVQLFDDGGCARAPCADGLVVSISILVRVT